MRFAIHLINVDSKIATAIENLEYFAGESGFWNEPALKSVDMQSA